MVAMDENIVLKTDRRGRVRTPVEQREHAVAEWERSGLSARRFAEMAGVKYQTFAAWVARKRKAGGDAASRPAGGPPGWIEVAVGGGSSDGLRVELPGGAALMVRDAGQAALAGALLRALAEGRP